MKKNSRVGRVAKYEVRVNSEISVANDRKMANTTDYVNYTEQYGSNYTVKNQTTSIEQLKRVVQTLQVSAGQ